MTQADLAPVGSAAEGSAEPEIELDVTATAVTLTLSPPLVEVERSVVALGPGVDDRPWRPGPSCRYRGWRLVVKRGVDRVAALVVLAVALPVLFIVSVLVLATSGRPVFFRQERLGRGGRTFEMIKFRSMHTDAEARLRADPQLWAHYEANDFKLDLGDDPRLAPLGRFLRKSSIDELPQLWNVLRGDMSLVGPRPIVPDELAEYEHLAPAYLLAYPGMTGRWQVSGRNEVMYPRRAELDAEYVEEWSLVEDLVLLLRTGPAVVRGAGTH